MNIRIPADGATTSLARAIAEVLLPVVIWVAAGVWQNYSASLILGISVPIAAFSLWAIWRRGTWSEIVVEPDSLTLNHRNGSQQHISRDSIEMLEVRDKCLVLKWKAEPKARAEVIGRERFSQQSWSALSAALKSWKA